MAKNDSGARVDHIARWQTPRLFENTDILTEETRTEEEIRKQVYEESYVKGYQAGMKAGQEKINQQMELVNAFISMLSAPFHDMNNQIIEELAALAGKIARGLVKRELRTDPETIMAIIRDSIRTLGEDTKSITVYLHPEDAGILREINKRMTEKQYWDVVEDPLLSRGDCRVSKNDSLIDENIQSRINIIITQFLGDERHESRKSQ